MRLKPCSSCERLVRTGDACPFCGETAPPSAFAPQIAAVVLSLPLLAATACTRPAESIYGGPEMLDPAPAPAGATTPVPEKPAEADPPKPTEPQGEIYGTPQMMDSSADEPIKAPQPDSGADSGQPGSDEAEPKEPEEPAEPIYGGPEMLDPAPSVPKK